MLLAKTTRSYTCSDHCALGGTCAATVRGSVRVHVPAVQIDRGVKRVT